MLRRGARSSVSWESLPPPQWESCARLPVPGPGALAAHVLVPPPAPAARRGPSISSGSRQRANSARWSLAIWVAGRGREVGPYPAGLRSRPRPTPRPGLPRPLCVPGPRPRPRPTPRPHAPCCSVPAAGDVAA